MKQCHNKSNLSSKTTLNSYIIEIFDINILKKLVKIMIVTNGT